MRRHIEQQLFAELRHVWPDACVRVLPFKRDYYEVRISVYRFNEELLVTSRIPRAYLEADQISPVARSLRRDFTDSVHRAIEHRTPT